MTKDLPQDRIIRFTSDTSVELPDPVILATHYAVTNILHATGMAEEIDQSLREIEDIDIEFAEDGMTDVTSGVNLWMDRMKSPDWIYDIYQHLSHIDTVTFAEGPSDLTDPKLLVAGLNGEE